jgi:eukaryotic translation initiation factor 2C
VATLDRRSLDGFLAGAPGPAPQEHLQALDVLLREHPAARFAPVGRSFFHRELGCAGLDGGLVAVNGFYQSLRATHAGLQLNVDLSTAAFHASIPVIDFLRKQLRGFDPRSRLSDAARLKVRRALCRLKVQVIHRQTPRRYRISGLSASPTKELTFPVADDDGGGTREMRVVDYFKATYNCVLEYPELPCLQVHANKPSYLPMEVCVICDGQKYGGRLDERQTKSLRELACVPPRVREAKILRIMGKDDGPGR